MATGNKKGNRAMFGLRETRSLSRQVSRDQLAAQPSLRAARLGLWFANHDLRLGYEPFTS